MKEGDTYILRFYKESAQAVIEANNSQDLRLASWRSKNADGIVPVQVWRPENQERQ